LTAVDFSQIFSEQALLDLKKINHDFNHECNHDLKWSGTILLLMTAFVLAENYKRVWRS